MLRKKSQKSSPSPRVIREYVRPREDEPIREEVVPPDDETELNYESFISGFPQEGLLIKVHRDTERGREYCFRAKPHELSDVHESLRQYHAKQPYASERGDYTLEVFVNGDARNTFNVSIAPQAAAHVSSTGGIAGQTDVVRLLADQNARLEARLLQVQQAEREPLSALADAMLKLQQVQGGNRQELPIETVMKCIELGKELGGGAAPSDDWKSWLLPVLKDSMPLLQGIIAGASGQKTAALPAPAPPGVAPTMPNDDQMLLAGIAYLKQKCLARSHPGLYVELIYDNKDAPQYQGLIRRILTNELSELAKLDPQILQPPYAEFFKYVFDGLRSAFAADDPVDADISGTGGDAPDASSNGAARASSSKKR